MLTAARFFKILLRILAGGVFAYSGWNKLIRPVEEFRYSIEQYRAFPSALTRLLSNVLPWFELIFGTFLLIGFLRKASAGALNMLCAGFLILLFSTMIRHIDISNCGCFGEGIHLSAAQALALDSCLFLSLLFLARVSEIDFEFDARLKKKND